MPAIKTNWTQKPTVHFLTVKAREGTSKEHFADMVRDHFRKQRTSVRVQVVKEPYKTPDRHKHFIWPDGRAYHYHLVYFVCDKDGKAKPSKGKKLWHFLTKEGSYAGVHFMHILPSRGNSAADILNKYVTDPKKLKECDPDLYGDTLVPEWKIDFQKARHSHLRNQVLHFTNPDNFPLPRGRANIRAYIEDLFGPDPREEDYRPTT